jgi:acetyl esterase/lipase
VIVEPGDLLELVDPDLRALAAQSYGSGLTVETLPAARTPPATLPAPAPAPQPAFRRIPGAGDAPDVRLMVIDGTGGREGRPAYVYMHGGGFVAGSLEGSTLMLQAVSAACRCLVVSVDYRLAPETPFPGALEDNFAALRWVYDNAASLGVDRARIAIGGGSAGGGHAAMLALAARRRGEVPICHQHLIYPMLDDRTGSSREPSEHVGRYIWTSQANRFGWGALLGHPPGGATAAEGAVPAREEDLRGLPPTFIGVGGLDLFIDENIEYAQRLIAAGVRTELLVAPGAFHGFDVFAPQAGVSVRFRAASLAALSRGLGVADEGTAA